MSRPPMTGIPRLSAALHSQEKEITRLAADFAIFERVEREINLHNYLGPPSDHGSRKI